MSYCKSMWTCFLRNIIIINIIIFIIIILFSYITSGISTTICHTKKLTTLGIIGPNYRFPITPVHHNNMVQYGPHYAERCKYLGQPMTKVPAEKIDRGFWWIGTPKSPSTLAVCVYIYIYIYITVIYKPIYHICMNDRLH